MKKIKIFLASSLTELQADRKAIGDFFNQLNEIYLSRGIHFSLVKCEDIDNCVAMDGKQAEYDAEIRDSELCFVLFFKKIGDMTRHEFEVALDSFRRCKKPKIVVYFKYDHNEEDSDDVKAFKRMLDNDIKYYYNIYQNIDTLKLGILMQIKIMQLDFEEPVVQNGNVLFGGAVIADVANVPIFAGNKSLSALRSRLEEITPAYFELQAQFVKNPNDIELLRNYGAVASEKAELENQIKQLEKSVLAASKTLLETTSRGNLSPRQVAAYRALEKGDYDGALTVLDMNVIMADLSHNEHMTDGYARRVQTNVNELLSRADVLRSRCVTAESASQIKEIFQTIFECVEKYDLDRSPLFAYAWFLKGQNDYAKAIAVAKQLQYDYSAPLSDVPEVKFANLYALLGSLYSSLNDFAAAEEYFKRALNIRKKLAVKHSDAHDFELANICNDLGILYSKTNRYALAEKTYKKALAIYDKLVKKDDVCRAMQAVNNNNLGLLYLRTGRFSLAEASLEKARALFEKMAAAHPEVHASDLAKNLNNLGNLYARTRRFEIAELTHKKALAILQRCAAENPHVFEPKLAECCVNLGNLYDRAKLYDKANAAHKTALSILKRYAAEFPDVYGPNLAHAYNNVGVLCTNKEKYDAAEKYFKKALAIYQKAAKKQPDVFAKDLANVHNNLGAIYHNTERYAMAEEEYKSSHAILKRLASENPDVYTSDLAESCGNLGLLYSLTSRHDMASAAYQKQLELCAKLANKNRDVYAPKLAESYEDIAVAYYNSDQTDKAIEAWQAAAEIYADLAAHAPDVYAPKLAKIYDCFSKAYAASTRPNMANDAFKKAYAIAQKYPQHESCAAILAKANGINA